MLQKLFIQNVALIDSAEINFKSGLNVLSGETGAGKSVIIESLNFVLGAKADTSLIRSGESECWVKAEFDVAGNSSVLSALDELDIEREDTLIISRKLNDAGRSVVKVNGNTVTVGMLKKLTAYLVDVHGQSEHFYLLKNTNQLSLIDKFVGEEIVSVKQEISSLFKNYKQVKKELDELGGFDEAQRLMRLDVLDYQIREIEQCDLKDGEEDELKEIKEKLVYQEKILLALNSVSNAINGEGGVGDTISNLLRVTSSVSTLGKDLGELNERLNSVFSELDDLGSFASDLIDGFDAQEYSLDEVENRLQTIKNIKKKYGDTFDEIQEFLSSAITEKNNLENFTVLAEELLNKRQKLEDEIYDKYLLLSGKRKDVSALFAKNVLTELKELGMSNANFDIAVNTVDKQGCKFDSENGIDDIEFMFSANLGEPLKPMSAVISGGEISRFMLAIKAQTAKYNEVSTFIFDEIDTGISGFVAQVVAEKFAKIALDVQIIAITHLPQISAMADNNLLILKSVDGQKTVTTVKNLDKEEKLAEISRLCGGTTLSDLSRAHAQELIDRAQGVKQKLKQ